MLCGLSEHKAAVKIFVNYGTVYWFTFTWILECRSKQYVELHLHAPKTCLYAGTVFFKHATPRMCSEFVLLNKRTTKWNVWTNSSWSPFRHEIIVFSHHIHFLDIFSRMLFSITKDRVCNIALAESKTNVLRWRQRHNGYEIMEDRSTL